MPRQVFIIVNVADRNPVANAFGWAVLPKAIIANANFSHGFNPSPNVDEVSNP